MSTAETYSASYRKPTGEDCVVFDRWADSPSRLDRKSWASKQRRRSDGTPRQTGYGAMLYSYSVQGVATKYMALIAIKTGVP